MPGSGMLLHEPKGGLLQAGGLGGQTSPQAGLCSPPAAREDSLTPHLFNSTL